ncbi:MAG: sulfatase-like hydrolase/transferase [Ardenticatenaceae bacterium]|nr:sulfatase-like hydrolase/transferase [Ardenticatenaceae bacterium]
MTKMNRRTFLKLLPTVPFFRVAWPAVETAVQNKINPAQSSDQPNILFLVFDTLTAQQMSLYGYNRDTTPNMARFAEKSAVFHKHVAGGNFTSPGTSTLMTGTYPWTHRAIQLHGLVHEEFVQKNIFSMMPENYHTEAYTHNLLVMSLLHQFRGDLDLFKKTRELCLHDGQFSDRLFFEDYTNAFWAETTALQGGATPPGALFLSLLDRFANFAETRSFEQELAELYPRGIPNLHSLSFLLEDAIDWIQEQVVTMPQPFMGYFHLLPPHEPYAARADFVDIFTDGWQPTEKPKLFGSQNMPQAALNRERRLYDEYLAFTDAEFGRLMDNLEQKGVLDDTYIILTSDHGELFERGIRGHVTLTLYEGLTHVPLLIHKPGQQTREDVFQRTSATDILPTLMQLTGQPVPDWCEGAVLPTFGGPEAQADRFVYSVEAKSNPKYAALTEATVAMYQDDLKLIRYFGYTDEDKLELYNLADDPEELNNLYESETGLASDLTTALKDKIYAENAPYRRE